MFDDPVRQNSPRCDMKGYVAQYAATLYTCALMIYELGCQDLKSGNV